MYGRLPTGLAGDTMRQSWLILWRKSATRLNAEMDRFLDWANANASDSADPARAQSTAYEVVD